MSNLRLWYVLYYYISVLSFFSESNIIYLNVIVRLPEAKSFIRIIVKEMRSRKIVNIIKSTNGRR